MGNAVHLFVLPRTLFIFYPEPSTLYPLPYPLPSIFSHSVSLNSAKKWNIINCPYQEIHENN